MLRLLYAILPYTHPVPPRDGPIWWPLYNAACALAPTPASAATTTLRDENDIALAAAKSDIAIVPAVTDASVSRCPFPFRWLLESRSSQASVLARLAGRPGYRVLLLRCHRPRRIVWSEVGQAVRVCKDPLEAPSKASRDASVFCRVAFSSVSRQGHFAVSFSRCSCFSFSRCCSNLQSLAVLRSSLFLHSFSF